MVGWSDCLLQEELILVRISMCAMVIVDTHWSSKNRVKCKGYVLNNYLVTIQDVGDVVRG